MMKSLTIHATLAASACANYINYTTVAGYFLQDNNSTNATTFDYTATNFGLINQTYASQENCPYGQNATQWQRFAYELARLNHEAPPLITYKLLFLARHGEGWHNAAESYYGTPAWNCYWSLLNGNATANWADAELTQNGIRQALIANKFWASRLEIEKTPAPESYYTSPLQRCLATANLTFSNLTLPQRYPFKPTIKEFFREGISIHTCDRRHNKTYIHSQYPSWPFEPGFAESDPYWTGVYGETNAAQDVRSKAALDSVFSNDTANYISITSHSGEIASILRVLGHRSFGLNTGAVIPVLVKAETMNEQIIAITPAFTVSPHCTAPPATSISGGPSQGCICASSAMLVTTPLITLGPFRK